MLKKIIIIVLSVLTAGIVLALLQIIGNKVIVASATDLNTKRVYSAGSLQEQFINSFILAAFFFLIYCLIAKLIFRKNKSGAFWIALITGLVIMGAWYVLTNTLVMSRPHITDPIYLSDLLTMFIIGFLLPYLERFISNLFAKKLYQ